MSHQQAIQKLLTELGPTSDAVASVLRDAKIRGVRNTVRYLNPIVRYIQDRLQLDDYTIDVWTSDGSQNFLRVNGPDGKRQDVPLPDAVREFLDAFNRGDFSDLELPPITDG